MDCQDTYHAIDRALQTSTINLDAMRRCAIDAVSVLTPKAIADLMIATIQQVSGASQFLRLEDLHSTTELKVC